MSSPQQHSSFSWEPITLPASASVSEEGLRIILAQQQHIKFLLQQLPSHEASAAACPASPSSVTDLDNPVVRPSRPDSPGNEGAVVDSDEDFVPELEYRRAKRSKRTVRRAASLPWDISRDLSKGGRPSGCSTEVVECIRQYMTTRASYTQQEVTQHIARTLGVKVSRPTVCRWMQRIRAAPLQYATGTTTNGSNPCNNATDAIESEETDQDDDSLASSSTSLSLAESISTSSAMSIYDNNTAEAVRYLSEDAAGSRKDGVQEHDKDDEDEQVAAWRRRGEELLLAPMLTFEEMVWELELDATLMLGATLEAHPLSIN